MTARLNPYLNFADQAREALAFYQSILGGDLQLMTFAQGGMTQDPALAERIMHGQLETPSGFTLMASDTPPGMAVTQGSNISISLSGDDEALLRAAWDGLVAGGEVIEPLVKAPWGDTFGMLTDRFGIRWMVDIASQPG